VFALFGVFYYLVVTAWMHGTTGRRNGCSDRRGGLMQSNVFTA